MMRGFFPTIPEKKAEAYSMKVVILAGGLGTRLQEETSIKPKPMVEVGGRPIIWHIMKGYAAFGYREFVVALGYRGEVLKDYFLNYHHHARNLTVRLDNGRVTLHPGECEDWTVHLVDTGLETRTGGRVKRAAEYIGREPFLLTYGDGVGNIDISKLVEFHRSHGKLATITAVRPPARFGQMEFEGEKVVRFEEKPQIGEGWINGGFFVFQPRIAEFIAEDRISLEREPLERLAADGQLAAYRHDGFWHCMDTLRDVQLLEKIWSEGDAPWKVWP
jgi:glucose-1-phosphate cytidylyltransferase